MDLVFLVAAQLLVIATIGRALQWLYASSRLVMLCAAVFVALGAYALGLGAQHMSVPVLYAAGGVLAGALGYVLGWLVGRLRGDYFAIATYLFQISFVSVLLAATALTRGSLGLAGIPGPIAIAGNPWLGGLALGVAYAVLGRVVLHRLQRSALGDELTIATRDSAFAASLGIGAHQATAIAVGAVGFICAIGGSLLAQLLSYIDPAVFGSAESLLYLSIALVGALAGRFGIWIGAVLYVGAPVLLRFIDASPEAGGALRQLLLALMLLVSVVWWRLRPRPMRMAAT